jgi:hypothetical protein
MDKDQIIKFEKHRLENVMPNNKCCNKCKVAKPIDEFYENRHSLDGLQSICISCSKSKLNTNTNNRARATWMANYAPILEEDIKALLEASDYRCTYCGIEVYKGKNLEYDHKIPICRGGPHTIENLAVACSKDNRRKGRMTDTEYKEQLKQKEQMLIKTGDAQPITIIKTDLPDDQITKKALDKALEKVKSEQLETDRSKLKPE